MKNAAEPLAGAVVGRRRWRAPGRFDLRRAKKCAENDAALSERREMRDRDRRLSEKKAGHHRREHARAQTLPLNEWSHRRLSVSRGNVRFRTRERSSNASAAPCGETTRRI